MKKGTRKGKEEDEETRSEEREAVSIFGGIEAVLKELKSQLTIDPARQEGPATPKADSSSLTEEESNFIFALAYEGHSFNSIMDIMHAHNFIINPLELARIMKEVEHELRLQDQAEEREEEREEEEEEEEEEKKSQYEDGRFEAYDPVKWALATEEETVDKARDEKNVPKPDLYRTDKAVPEMFGIPFSPIDRGSKNFETEYEEKIKLSNPLAPEFVRALKDSKMGTKPYFRKGDILRVINKARRKKLDDLYFELLPLRPPGESGKALIKHFEPANTAAAEEVGREARNEKEIDSFRCAMDWED